MRRTHPVYRYIGITMHLNLARELQRVAAAHGQRSAISLGTKPQLDHEGLAEQAARIGAALRSSGLRPGDRVAMVMSNHIAFFPVLFGIWHAGLIAAPVNAYGSPEQARQAVEASGATTCFVTPNLIRGHGAAVAQLDGVTVIDVGSDGYRELLTTAPIEVVEPEGGAEATAWLMFTSGTSGAPKGVMLSHGAIARNCRRFLDEVEAISPEDNLLHVTAMSHGSGVLGVAHVFAGANQVIPKSGGLAPRELVKLIHHWPHSRICLAPVVMRLLREIFAGKAQVFAPLEAILYGSAPMRQVDIRDSLAFFGPKLVQLYGLCEAPGSLAHLSREDHVRVAEADDALAPVGRVRREVQVKVLDDAGRELEAGQIGHIRCLTDARMSGYWQDPERSAAALDGDWLVTNDVGFVDAEGFLHLVGRRDGQPLDAPDRSFPFVVEDRLSRHPDVRDCAVVSDPGSGELVGFAMVRPGRDLDEAELASRYAGLARAPVAHVQVGAIPYSTTGKVLRPVLEREAAERGERWTAWQRFEIPPVQGLQLRLARTVDDARAIREMVREAWQLAPEDKFFYHRFEDPQWVFEHLILPLSSAETIEELSAIALVAVEDGVVFGTASMVFDHTRRIVEVGRGAIRPSQQGASRARRLAMSIIRLLEMVPHYNAVVDATIVHFGAGNFAEAINAVAVGLYPTSFVFQRGTAPQWHQSLVDYHGREIADAMVYLSPRTGMGRFGTAYHMRLAPQTRLFTPVLTAEQQTMFKWTCDALKLRGLGEPQAPQPEAESEVYDNPGTSLRSVHVSGVDFDVEACMRTALEAGLETLILRVPCDSEHVPLSRTLDGMRAILAGVHPDALGYWTANYVLPLGEGHYERTVEGLELMARRATPMAYAHLLSAVTGVQSDATTRELRSLPKPTEFLDALKELAKEES